MKLIKYLLTINIVISSSIFGANDSSAIIQELSPERYDTLPEGFTIIDPILPIAFPKENTSVSLLKKQNKIRIFGYTFGEPKKMYALQIDAPIENNLIETNVLGYSLIDFVNLNPKEIKVTLTDCADCSRIEEFSIQPDEITLSELSGYFELFFSFTNNDKKYLVFLESIKSKPALSDLKCLVGVCKNK